MTLQEWQQRLEKHFGELRKARPAESPLFALEHGLSEVDFSDLKKEILVAVSAHSFLNDTPLPWVVYAAEIGYQYSGEEYWGTFEENTPNWVGQGNRWWIRNCFINFSNKFNGAKPSGPWAENYSIICWPITHAILPKDLQWHLARLLWKLRYLLKQEHFEAPYKLGQLLAAHGQDIYSSRFRLLLQMPELVGQISSALLSHDTKFSANLLYPSTLTRIALDLDAEKNTSNYIRQAKNRTQYFQFSGFKHATTTKTGAQTGQKDGVIVQTLGIEPLLILKPIETNKWLIFLRAPSFSPIRTMFPHLAPILSRERCRVENSTLRSPLAGGRLLYGEQELQLKDWPIVLTPFSFENSTKELDDILKTECCLRPGPIWLFHIQTDGVAYELKGKTVRPGHTYILVSSIPLPELGKYANHTQIANSIYAVKISVPEFISEEFTHIISGFGITPACEIEVWPVGLPPVFWDKEGHAEWVSPDTPRVGISIDHTVKSLDISIDGRPEDSLKIIPTESQSNYFIEFPGLGPGVYQATFTPEYSLKDTPSLKGRFEIVIQEPTWYSKQASSSKFPLRVFIEPPQPTVEQLWQGECQIETLGPADKPLVCTLELLERDPEKPLASTTFNFPKMTISPKEWDTAFSKALEASKEVQEKYSLASKLSLTFNADELGHYVLSTERQFTAVRWVLLRDKRTLRLIDDSGTETKPLVYFFSFREPDKKIVSDLPNGKLLLKGDELGGVYFAEVDKHRDAIMISPFRLTLEELKLKPKLQRWKKTCENYATLVQIASAWANAKTSGNNSIVGEMWRSGIIKDIKALLVNLIFGADWYYTEKQSPEDIDAYLTKLLTLFTTKYPKATRLKDALNQDNSIWADLSASERVEKFSVLIRGEAQWGESLSWHSEFFLRLASAPETLKDFAGNSLIVGFHKVIPRFLCLLFAARYIVLSSTYQSIRLNDNKSTEKVWLWR